MKKSLLLFAILFLGYGVVLAQNMSQKITDKKGLKRLNVSVGTTFSNFISSNDAHLIWAYIPEKGLYSGGIISDYETNILEDIKTGLSFSLGFEYYLKNNLSINFGLSYEERGIDLSTNTTFWESKVRHTLEVSNHYVMLPISLRRYFKNDKFYLQGGIYTGYLLNSDIKTYTRSDYDNSVEEYTYNGKGKDYTKNFDFGVLFGAGFSQRISKNLFFNTNILLSIGMFNIDDKVSYYNHVKYRKPSYKYLGLTNVKNIACKVSAGVAYQF